MPAMSSASIALACVVARVSAVDMALDVQVCCRPSACPTSCTAVVKNSSLELMDCCERLRRTRMTLEVMALNGPFGPLLGIRRDVGPACSTIPGGISSLKMICTEGVLEAAPGL